MTPIALRQSGTSFTERAAALIAPALADTAQASANPSGLLRFEMVDTMAGFEALEAEWTQLFASAARPEHVFQSYAWNWHWCQHYLPRDGQGRMRLAIVAGRMDGRLVLLLPLVTVRKAGLKQIGWMGEPVSQYGDAIAAPAAQNLDALKAAWSFAVAKTEADLANLRKVRAGAVVEPLLKALGARITATETAPYVDLAGSKSFECFEALMPTKRKRNRRRQMRRLQELGPIAFGSDQSSGEASLLARYAISMKRAWLKTRNLISLAIVDERYSNFFAAVSAGDRHPTDCKVLQIRSRNETAAMQVIIECKGVRFLHIAVYALKFEKFGAGSLLLEQAIRTAIEDGCSQFDLLAPKHEYKLEFADKSVDVNDYAFGATGKGHLYTTSYLGMRRRLKVIAESMPAPLKRAFVSAVSLIKRKK